MSTTDVRVPVAAALVPCSGVDAILAVDPRFAAASSRPQARP